MPGVLPFANEAGESNQESFPFLYQQVCNFMYLLAKCGQIDESYLTDKAKFFEHAWLLAVGYDCAYNHIIQTGSHLIK